MSVADQHRGPGHSAPADPPASAPVVPPASAPLGAAAPEPDRPPARPARPPNTRFLRSEIRLIFGRRRNWAGMALLAAVPIVLAIAVKVSAPSGTGGGPDFVSAIAGNGFFVALAALGLELNLFLPIAVAAISGDSVAGEANTGTLRYLLIVPVDRNRVLAVKYAGIAVFAFAVTLLVAAVGLAIGLTLFGAGPVTLLSGAQIGMGSALLRLLGICVYLAVALCALGAIGLFVSTLTEQPMGAGLAILMLCVTSFILDAIPQLDWLHPYLLTHNWQSFGDLLREPVAFGGLRAGLESAAAYIVIFLSAAWARFGVRDITS